ncbi:hypothetical protein A1O3_09992 [Capronia epimyces CBS 606.96]|uniref:Uncharacterized protein n=1 Tax=Capronia epimyces CBS 606.96 TaxID=1182542 RepID=W9XC00_9EURO|nr:uncharacterized protein A1O3_09992 [Capronia epimyces CBS 606.96]EXJ77763.1 hypothetical protein A1O3_09992 [Capronia epimyces CBS 606.96]
MARVRSHKYQQAKKARNASKYRGRKTQGHKRAQETRASPSRPQSPLPLGERKAMFLSMMHFLSQDGDKSDQILRMLQSTEPAFWTKLSKSETVRQGDLSDEGLRAVSQIIYDRNTARDVDIVVPQQQLTKRMQQFNVAYMRRLPVARLEELHGIIRSVAPTVALLDVDAGRRVEPNFLPPNVQMMIFKYLNRHLPDEVMAEARAAEGKAKEEEEGEEGEETGGLEGEMEDAGEGMDVDEAEDGHEDAYEYEWMEMGSQATSETNEEL